MVSLKLADQIIAPTEKLLRLQEIDSIHHAREVLLRNISNPPSLIDLAKQVGINECTLKRGFRQIFGTTVFGYLHDYRMEQARQLLLSGQMKIEQVAQIVGYANRSRFASAFKKKYGVNPKAYQMQQNI